MSLDAMQKTDATLLQLSTTKSATYERIPTWTAVGTFKCVAGAPRGSTQVTIPGRVFPDSRIFMTTSSLGFQEGMRIRVAGTDWLIIDVLPGRSLYGCGRTMFIRIRTEQVLGE